MSPTHRGTRIEVRKNHLKHNIQALQKMAGTGFFCPMVKANAYGHGVETLVPVMQELSMKNLGVVTWDEALELRALGFKDNILVFSRTHGKDEAELSLAHAFTPVVSRLEDLEFYHSVTTAQNKKLQLHLKFDTGMHRMGFAAEQAGEVNQFLQRAEFLNVEGVLTHMSHGEDAAQKDGHTRVQIKRLLEIKKAFPKQNPFVHALNSSALLSLTEAGEDVDGLGARPGIALYGAVKDPRLSAFPALKITSQVDHIQRVPKGEGASYGWTWTAQRDSVVGIIPFGYGDGYHRGLSNKTFMLVRGQKVPQIGTICMDYTLIDLTDLGKSGPVQVGEEVVLLGEQGQGLIHPEDLAAWGGTISYEVLTSMGLRKNRAEVKG